MNKTALRRLCSLTLAPWVLAAAPQHVWAQARPAAPAICTMSAFFPLTPQERYECGYAGYGGAVVPGSSGYGGAVVPAASTSAGGVASSFNDISVPLRAATALSVRSHMDEAQTRQQQQRRAAAASFDSADARARRQALNVYTDAANTGIDRDAADNVSGFRVRLDTATLGADKRLSDAWVLGAAIGATRTRIRFDSNASRQDSHAQHLTAYSSWNPTAASYVSATASYERSNIDLRRDDGQSALLNAHTRSQARGFGLAAGTDLVAGAFTVSPYLRLDTVSTHIAGFDETGGATATSIGGQSLRSNSANVGVNLQRGFPQSWGSLLPYVRLEATHRSDSSSSSATARLLADNTSLLIPTAADVSPSYGSLALGVSAVTPYGYSAFFDVQSNFGQKGYRFQHVSAGIRFEL